MRPSYTARLNKELEDEVEKVRQELVRAVRLNGSLVHDQVLHVSQQLDKLIFELQIHKDIDVW